MTGPGLCEQLLAALMLRALEDEDWPLDPLFLVDDREHWSRLEAMMDLEHLLAGHDWEIINNDLERAGDHRLEVIEWLVWSGELE